MKGLFGNSIWDEMDEYWIYQQVQKEIEEENKDPLDDFDDDLLSDDLMDEDMEEEPEDTRGIYDVSVSETREYTMQVKAEDMAEAEDIARELTEKPGFDPSTYGVEPDYEDKDISSNFAFIADGFKPVFGKDGLEDQGKSLDEFIAKYQDEKNQLSEEEKSERKVRRVVAKAVKKEEIELEESQPYRPQPTIVQAPREVVPQPPSATERHGCGWLFLVFAVLLFAWVGIDNYQGKQNSYDDYVTTTPATSYTTTAYEPVTEVRSTTAFTTRYSMSRTKEDFYGVHDYVDAADFADEMAGEEFDGDWEEAYDYYEENY